MDNRKKSDSAEQQRAEEIIFEKIKPWLGVELERNPRIPVGTTYMEPDFYSRDAAIVGEIYAHIGRRHSGQNDKIAADILKMLLLEKLEGKRYRKIFAVCDEELYKKINNGISSVLAVCFEQFGVEIKMIDIGDEAKDVIVAAQKRQRMINVW